MAKRETKNDPRRLPPEQLNEARRRQVGMFRGPYATDPRRSLTAGKQQAFIPFIEATLSLPSFLPPSLNNQSIDPRSTHFEPYRMKGANYSQRKRKGDRGEGEGQGKQGTRRASRRPGLKNEAEGPDKVLCLTGRETSTSKRAGCFFSNSSVSFHSL